MTQIILNTCIVKHLVLKLSVEKNIIFDKIYLPIRITCVMYYTKLWIDIFNICSISVNNAILFSILFIDEFYGIDDKTLILLVL